MKNIRSYIIATAVAVLVLILYFFLMYKFVPDISVSVDGRPFVV
jgi:uncharacterized BrkB/YihY/UPF0761 family membrane protein